jgi:hypothetical protein
VLAPDTNDRFDLEEGFEAEYAVSRPMPDCLYPPNGASGSCGAPLITTRPDCSRAAMARAWRQTLQSLAALGCHLEGGL